MSDTCTCTWAPLGETGGQYMTERDARCVRHGNGAWWDRMVAHAEEIAATRPPLTTPAKPKKARR